MPPKLMIPGPIDLEDEVLEWMGAPNHAHYGEEFMAVHQETISLLKEVIGTAGHVYIMPGSGTMVNDAAVHNLFAPGEKVVVGINGFFGGRLREILAANRLEVVPVEKPPGQALDPADFERALEEHPEVVGVVVVHLETSTAILNPVREIAAIARQHDRLCMVDAVSSLGGTEFYMDDWGMDVCVSASQKGLGAAPGLGVIGISDHAWEVMNQKNDSVRSWYLDFVRWQWYVENWGDWHPYPVTMPSSIVLGLRAALQSIHRQGLPARLDHYRELARRLRDGLLKQGFKLFVPEDLMAPVLTAVYCPEGIVPIELIKCLEARHNIKITGGLGEFRKSVVRIGHMGGALCASDIDELLDATEKCLVELKP